MAGLALSPFDTIASPITGLGRAAVAVVRLSGPEAWSIGQMIFSPWIPESHHAAYGQFATGDDGLALPFAEGRSYTGEETVEFSVHGSPVSVRLLMEALIAAGARQAEPGEFTLRAFMNGRIDLNQAEAVRELVDAETELALRAASAQRKGAASTQASAIRDELLKVVAAIEASVDFGEEVGEFEPAPGQFERLLAALEGLLRDARRSQILRQGLRVALVGRPNAGKSSLLNALLGSSRAIVTEIPGTTRDFIEEKVDLDGLPVVLIDTAGLRDTQDPVELAGIARTREIAATADEVWFLFDSSEGWTEEDQRQLDGLGVEARLLANKADVGKADRGFPISASTGHGIPDLIAKLKAERDLLDPPRFVATERHLLALEEAREAVALVAQDTDAPYDVMVSALRLAVHALGEITGESASEDMIERIFRDFCIGK